MAKFDRLPPGVADILKSNATFVEEDGPMREAVLAASPLTKEDLLRNSPGAIELAMKARRSPITGSFSILVVPYLACFSSPPHPVAAPRV